jgi:hypothetical protein
MILIRADKSTSCVAWIDDVYLYVVEKYSESSLVVSKETEYKFVPCLY